MVNESLNKVAGALGRAWTNGRRMERIAYVIGAVLFASGLVHAGVLIFTGGSWEGPLSLRKPTTFGLSFGLTLVSLAWVTSFVEMRPRLRSRLLGLFTATSVAKVALVSMQAWRGVPSHFNFETPFDNTVSMILAAGGGLIIITVFGFTAAAMVGTRDMSPSMRLAVRFGVVSLMVALVSGAIMIGRGVSLARGGEPQLAYLTAGGLKPLHAVAMHGILVLPGLAWMLGFSRWSARRQLSLVLAATVAYAALIAVVGIESFTGVSPLAAPPAETLVSGLAVAALGVLGATALRGLFTRDQAAVRA